MRTRNNRITVVPASALKWVLAVASVLGGVSEAMAQPVSAEPVAVETAQEAEAQPAPAGPQLEAPPVLEMFASEPAAAPAPDTAEPATEASATDTENGVAGSWDITALLLRIWRAELFSASGSPIKLNQLVLALLIILVGLWLSKRLSRVARRRLAKVSRINSHAAAVIEKVAFNTLVVIFVLLAMPIAGIPTTIFTVLGGALAIGVGFGAQNLFNNLISGLIIIMERPIRLGDIVEVGDHEGLIEAINNRCTTLRRPDGVDLLVPNSHFLEQPVVNWTLTNRNIRGKVEVGVAYGSPTDRVAQLLRQCMDEHSLIHERPEPVVLFESFGDNALVFEAYFWTSINRPMDLRKIQSDVRFRFDELSREAGIVIAYPQRDVHLDTLQPLEVRMVDGRGGGGTA